MFKREISQEDYKLYFGGSGIGAKILFEGLDPSLNPLDPECRLLVLGGMLTGVKVPCACRTVLCGRAPLTGIWGEATVGGYFGQALKATGTDGLVIEGRAPRPVYILLTEDSLEIKDATHLWGLDTFETEEAIRRETHPKVRVGAIGPSGERLVPMASVIFEGVHSRAAGRCGFGALMGSKNLKAIAALGRKRIPVVDPDGLRALVREQIPGIQKATKRLMYYGTAGGIEATEAHGDLPIQNWRGGSWVEGARAISGQTTLPRYLESHYACFACPIRCGKSIRIEHSHWGRVRSHQPEYETLAGFGSNLLNSDFESIAVANEMCNRYGLDTISTSSVIAFAIECFERGLLAREDTDGLELRWGDPQVILRLLRQIGLSEGLGALLGKGVREAAKHLGPLAAEFRTDVKGLEMAYHDPRAFTCMAANYATANRGACHLESLSYFLGRGISLGDMGYGHPLDPHTDDGKAKVAFDMQNYMSVFNALGLCKFLLGGRIGPTAVAKWVELTTGWPMDGAQVLKTGERIFNLKRMYNVKLGISRKDDLLPPRFLVNPRPNGRAQGVLPHLGRMLREYYELRGWDYEGIPSPDKLEELGLGWILSE